MGVGAAQDLGVQQAPRLEVGGKSRVPLNKAKSVHLDLGLADHRGRWDVTGWHQPGNGGRRVGCRISRVDIDRVSPIGHGLGDQRSEGFGLGTPQYGGRLADGGYRLHVGGLPVQDPREHVSDGLVVRVGVGLQ